MNRPRAIRSGGNTGADQGGLRAGLLLGYVPFETLGGYMPKGFRTDRGLEPWLRARYGMVELASAAYEARTLANIRAATFTILFGDMQSAGSRLTQRLALEQGRQQVRLNPTLDEIAEIDWTDHVVNVAGNREQLNWGIDQYVCAHLVRAWGSPELAATQPYPTPLPRLVMADGSVR